MDYINLVCFFFEVFDVFGFSFLFSEEEVDIIVSSIRELFLFFGIVKFSC